MRRRRPHVGKSRFPGGYVPCLRLPGALAAGPASCPSNVAPGVDPGRGRARGAGQRRGWRQRQRPGSRRRAGATASAGPGLAAAMATVDLEKLRMSGAGKAIGVLTSGGDAQGEPGSVRAGSAHGVPAGATVAFRPGDGASGRSPRPERRPSGSPESAPRARVAAYVRPATGSLRQPCARPARGARPPGGVAARAPVAPVAPVAPDAAGAGPEASPAAASPEGAQGRSPRAPGARAFRALPRLGSLPGRAPIRTPSLRLLPPARGPYRAGPGSAPGLLRSPPAARGPRGGRELSRDFRSLRSQVWVGVGRRILPPAVLWRGGAHPAWSGPLTLGPTLT